MKLPRSSTRLLQPPVSTPTKSYICRTCRTLTSIPLTGPHPSPRRQPTHYRAYSSQPPHPNPPHPPPSAFSHLPSRRLISLSGRDSAHFLQGAITANVAPAGTTRTSGFYAAFLNAQGRVLQDVFIYPDFSGPAGENWLIEVDADEAEKLARMIKRYRLRAKFEVRMLELGERGVWGVWDEQGEGAWTAHSIPSSGTLGAGRERESTGEISAADTRAPGMGRRVLLPGDARPGVDADEVSEDVYTVRRYLKGVPEGQREILTESALPQESNVDYMGGIDYRKGCYVGQELTIRTHHTGVVRKRILPVMLYGVDEPCPRNLEYRPEERVQEPPRETQIGRWEKKGRSAGKFLRAVGNVGLGLCRLEIMTDVAPQGEGGGYKEGDEFKFEWEEEGEKRAVKVKAFVPSWHLSR